MLEKTSSTLVVRTILVEWTSSSIDLPSKSLAS